MLNGQTKTSHVFTALTFASTELYAREMMHGFVRKLLSNTRLDYGLNSVLKYFVKFMPITCT